MNYKTIKELSKKLHVSYKELIALKDQNDPFYADVPGCKKKGEWFANLWHSAKFTNAEHLRRFHYFLISQQTLPKLPDGGQYEHTDKCWAQLLQASKSARWLGLVRFDAIKDQRNPDPHVFAKYNFNPDGYIDIPDFDDPYVNTDGFEIPNFQPYHLEVWCEKSTMDDIVLPVCEKYYTDYVTFAGETSITGDCVSLFQRIEQSNRKPVRIFYISDFDPAGNNIPLAAARKMEFMVRKYYPNIDIRLKQIALTKEQIQQYQLPSVPMKDTRRAGKFSNAFGMLATELDALEALHPSELAKIVSSELDVYFDKQAAGEAVIAEGQAENRLRERMKKVTDKYQPQIDAIKQMLEELKTVSTDIVEFVPEVAEPTVEEENDWLFDSGRDYLTQIQAYKKHKGQ